jgi:RNA polymerase sigma factor (sigma-70 family)
MSAGTGAVASPTPLKLQSTVDLVARVRRGDQEALEIICLRYLKALNRFAMGRLPQRVRGMVETQDLVAEALEKGLSHLAELDLQREGALMAYLRRILKNLIVDKIRACDRRPAVATLTDDCADGALSPLDKVLAGEKLELYEQALEYLKPRDAAAIILRVEEQADYDQIAIQLGMPTANAARVTVRRALFRLSHEMARLRRAKQQLTIEEGR